MPVELHPDLCFITADGKHLHRPALRRAAAALQPHFTAEVAIAAEDPFLLAAAILACFQNRRRLLLLPDLSPESRSAAAGTRLLGDAEIAALLSENPGEAEVTDFPEGELLLMSSGSGGGRKLICKTWSQLTLEAEMHAVFLAATVPPELITAGSVSPRHLYGLLFRLVLPLISGRPAESFHRRLPDQIQDLLAARPALFISSPSALAALARHPGSRVAGSLILSSGGPLSAKDAELLGSSLLELYGSSETGGIARRCSTSQPWQLLPGVTCRDEDGSAFSVRSPWLPDWQESGDRRVPLDESRFHLLGRADRLIKIGEKRFSLDDAEKALLSLPELADAAVAELGPGGELGRPLIGALVVEDRRRSVLDFRRELLAAGLDPLLIPRRFLTLDLLPRDPQGKLRRDLVRQLLLAPRDELPPTVSLGETAFRLRVPSSAAVLDGHFPLDPILPGLAQIHWAWSLACRVFPLPAKADSLQQLKFSRIVRPGDEIEVRFDVAPGSLGFRYFLGEAIASSGRFQWKI
ncbi:MAG: hypothetical protein RL095_1250 [Verrucomicrobiota bacterium]|jgi:acyl-coenzyme A synthetase/AMP-(fatty) acid ligase